MPQAGFEGRMFIGTEGNGASASDECTFARDVTINLTSDPIDVTSRDSAPWKDYIPGLREWSVSFNAVYINTDSALDALEAAYIAGTILSVRLIDNDGDGYYGDIIVTEFSREEPLADGMSRTVTMTGKKTPTRINVES